MIPAIFRRPVHDVFDSCIHGAVHDMLCLLAIVTSGLSVGCHYSFERAVEYQKKWVQEGANLIIHASDVSLYTRALTDDVRQLSEALSAPDGKRTADGRNDADVDV